MKTLLSFGGKQQGANRHCGDPACRTYRNYSREVERLFESAKPYGFDRMIMYDDAWLRNSKYCTPESIRVINEPSFGWMFKPAAIAAGMETISDGDYLMWVDSNDVFQGDPARLFAVADERGIYAHEHGSNANLNRQWTRRDMFVGMACDEAKYWNARQMQVNVMVFKKSAPITAFIAQWLAYASNFAIMIGEGKYQNFPEYDDHRHEQSIFTLLATKYGLAADWEHPYDVIAGHLPAIIKTT